jgi:hypothetical protein
LHEKRSKKGVNALTHTAHVRDTRQDIQVTAEHDRIL